MKELKKRFTGLRDMRLLITGLVVMSIFSFLGMIFSSLIDATKQSLGSWNSDGGGPSSERNAVRLSRKEILLGLPLKLQTVYLNLDPYNKHVCEGMAVQCTANPYWMQTNVMRSSRLDRSILGGLTSKSIPQRALIENYERIYAYSGLLNLVKHSNNRSELERTVVLVVPADRTIFLPRSTEESLLADFVRIQKRFRTTRVIFSARRENVPYSTADRVHRRLRRVWKRSYLNETELSREEVAPYIHSEAFIGYYHDVQRFVDITMEIIQHPNWYPVMWRKYGLVPSFRWQSAQGLIQALFATRCAKIQLSDALFPSHLRTMCSDNNAKGAFEEFIYPDFFREIFRVVSTNRPSKIRLRTRKSGMISVIDPTFNASIVISKHKPFDRSWLGLSKDNVRLKNDKCGLYKLEDSSRNVPLKWLSLNECSKSIVKAPPEEAVTILPFPWEASRWSRPGNFYHTMQCMWTGITEIDPERGFRNDVAQDWKHIRVAWTSRRRIAENKKNAVAPAIARVFDGRFNTEQKVIDTSKPWHNYFLSAIQDANATAIERRCRPTAYAQLREWLQIFFKSKFDCQLMRYNNEERMKNKVEYCRQSFKLSNISLLIVGRISERRSYDGSDLAQELRRTGRLGKVTSVRELSEVSLAEQSMMFATHNFILQPHGASGTGLIMANNASMSNGPPTINLELSPAYGHCSYPLNLTPDFFRDRLLSSSFGIAYEYPGMNCTEFDKRAQNSTADEPVLRRAFKDKYAHFAPGLNADVMLRIIEEKVHSVIIPHCLDMKPKLNPPIAWVDQMKDEDHILDLRKAFRVSNMSFPGLPPLSWKEIIPSNDSYSNDEGGE